MQELAVRVRSHGVQMDVAHVAPGLRRQSESVKGVDVFRVPLYGNRMLGWAPALGPLARCYDLLHVHDPQLLALTANLRFMSGQMPALLSTHGGFWHTNRHRLFKRIYERTLLRGSIGYYRRVLATSIGDEKYFQHYAERTELCGNGVDVKRFNAVLAKQHKSLNRWIYWGRLSRNKRIEVAIDYVAYARDLGHPVDLLICGRDFDHLMTDLQRQVARLDLIDFVRFQPFLDDASLLNELAQRSVYITASEHEGFGLSIVEAMAAGLVVICRDMVSLNGFLQHGRSGWLLRFDGNAQDLHALGSLLSTTPRLRQPCRLPHAKPPVSTTGSWRRLDSRSTIERFCRASK